MRFRNVSLTLLLFGLCGLVSLSWYTAFSSSRGDVVDIYQREFLALRERLHSVEQENLQRSKELNVVLEEIKRAIAEKQVLRDINRTWSSLSGLETLRPVTSDAPAGLKWSPCVRACVCVCVCVCSEETRLKLWNVSSSKNFLQLPSVLHHLPHLIHWEDSLQPDMHVGQGRTGVSIVMGVPSVKREVHSYLTDTLNSLMSQLSAAEKDDCVIVVLIAEADHEYAMSVAGNLKQLFPAEIQSGLLEVVSPSVHFYPDFSRLRESFGDPLERVKWRSKQNLDYCFLMMYAQSKGTFYVQLEDDIVARPNYLTTMKNFALQQPSEEWMILEFSQLGFIGKMFKSSDLSLIVEFMLMFYKDKPIDWLLDHIMWVKVCNPEKDAKHCDRQKANLRIRFKPSLFQHVGTHSSLAGKIQKLKDKDFGKQTLHKGHANPLAEVTTSLKTYQHFTLEKAYLGEDFFWAFTPVAGDFVRIRFFTPVRIERYFFRSGNIEHPGDKLFNTSVEVLPFDNIQADKEALADGKEKSQRYHRMEDGFIRIGMFQKGIAEGEVDPTFGPLEAMRLTVMTDSPVWVILSEIFIKKAE
ncbi:alpha-1,3-mannosyl-glycoprotein 4-beta-N-acetylglucosaminyltransferase B isoform X2 [Dunckerocampus dactyliophorus]|uniref:alpha-1,3-mannosyl-glycoprotein 4-beta-N-acetylglucosaminyltransferase B isoform X2 n=1 Tax=Dunckerocampus dactyliophorus TaxID=161453 RepID=UPI002406F86D|nr:alpha-1,3-mannosyl-glycoprotein 4-beta-N-acetylglucosaminyltransferase B isoform X2 [Dunckerocampus dactyliophorus]